jgi:hypothetical protein
MDPQIISDDQGEIFRLISKIKTTPHANDLPKSIHTESSTIEILIFDAILTAVGSQFGHVAIDIDGTIYSRAHSKYAEIKPASLFRDSNQKIRDFEGLTLRVSPHEKLKIKTELIRRVKLDRPYNIVNNSCSTNIADVLESIGILAHDPRFQLDPESTSLVSPKEILIIVSRSKRVSKRTRYAKLKNE